jgi:hypothetical protein
LHKVARSSKRVVGFLLARVATQVRELNVDIDARTDAQGDAVDQRESIKTDHVASVVVVERCRASWRREWRRAWWSRGHWRRQSVKADRVAGEKLEPVCLGAQHRGDDSDRSIKVGIVAYIVDVAASGEL